MSIVDKLIDRIADRVVERLKGEQHTVTVNNFGVSKGLPGIDKNMVHVINNMTAGPRV